MPDLVNHRRITSGSVDFLSVWIVNHESATLSAQPVYIAIQPRRVEPDEDTVWRSATWAGDAGTARAARILIGPGTSHVIPEGEYDVWSKVTDNPTIPETRHGQLTVT
jgi:hypothetical protein